MHSTGKLSLSMRDQDVKDGSKTDSPRSYNSRRFGDSSSHGKNNPFSTLSPSAAKSPSVGASSAFGLGSGAFASFGSAKTPKTPGTGSGFDFSSKDKKEKDAELPVEPSAAEPAVQSTAMPGSPAEHHLRNTWNLFYRPPANKFSDYEKSTLKLAELAQRRISGRYIAISSARRCYLRFLIITSSRTGFGRCGKTKRTRRAANGLYD